MQLNLACGGTKLHVIFYISILLPMISGVRFVIDRKDVIFVSIILIVLKKKIQIDDHKEILLPVR